MVDLVDWKFDLKPRIDCRESCPFGFMDPHHPQNCHYEICQGNLIR